MIFTDTRSPTEQELNNCQHITLTSSKIWNPRNIRFPKHTTIIEDNQFVVKSYNTSQRIFSINATRPRMVSAENSIEDNYYIFPMPAEELVEPGLCGTSYDIASLSQRLISTLSITDTPHEKAGADTKDVPTMKTFVSKERHSVVSSESMADRWFIGMTTQ